MKTTTQKGPALQQVDDKEITIAPVIVMKKEKDEGIFVWYRVEIDVVVNPKYDYEKRYGLFCYNKVEDSLNFIKEKTASEILNYKRIKFACHYKMSQCEKKNNFSPVLSYASCGL